MDAPKPDAGSPHTLDAAWELRHRTFHTALVKACDSPRLMAQRELLADMSDRYRHLSVAANIPGRDPAAEHRAIAEAVLARDGAKGSELMATHFLETARMVLVGFTDLDEAEVLGRIDRIRNEPL